MIAYDSHVHTSFSTDSDTLMEQMVLQGIQNGLEGITFTDHMDYHFPLTYSNWQTPDGMPPFTFDVDRYLSCLSGLKEKYHEKIDLFYGVEIGLKKDAWQENVALSRNPSFDYIIGSIHLVDDMDPYYPEYWESFEEKKGLFRYFETTYENLRSLGDLKIDTLGHLDYIVRYSPSGYKLYSYHLFSDIIDEILKLLIGQEISLEINTSGYKNGGPMPNPGEEIIRRYKELGGERITFGSDAHTTDLLSGRFDDVEKIAKKTGFRHYTTFVKRKPVFHTF